MRVSRLGLGTMTWGRDTDEHEASDQLRAFVDAGGTLVDTAPSYAEGAAEQILGQVLEGLLGQSGNRDRLVLATKGGIGRRGGRGYVDTSRRGLLAQLDTSLQRLGVGHVDLWQVHVWSDDVPIEEVLGTLEHAVSTGRARYVGVSNYSGWQLARAVTLQEAARRAPIVSNQVEYSLLARAVEAEAVPAARALGVGVLCWSPLGRGVLTGKYRSGVPGDSRGASAHFAPFVEAYFGRRSRSVVDAVVTAADGLGVSPVEVALSWARDRPGVASAVVGARTAAQLRGSLSAEDVVLPDAIREALDDVSAPGGTAED
nr:aldo/keto reductase [Motilibacter deserti]